MTAFAWKPEPLAPHGRPAVYRTPVRYFADRVRRQQFFTFARMSRSHWEAWLGLPGSAPATDPELIDEIGARLADLPDGDPDLFLATSHLPYPRADRHEAAREQDAAVLTAIEETLPRGFVAHDALLWKRATIDGSIRALYEALRPLHVVAVGPEWLIEVGGRLRLPRFSMQTLDVGAGREEREGLLARIEEEHAGWCGEPVAYLIDAGLASPWLALKLHRRLRNAFLLDVGSALDVCNPDRAREASWGRLHWHAIRHNLGLDLAREQDASTLRPRIHTAPAEAVRAPAAPARIHRERTSPAFERRGGVRFVENKDVDFTFVEDVLAESERRNHWTNFGPTTERLEEVLAERLALPSSRCVVMCASGTAALFGLAALASFRAGRPLRWVTSAFGFHPARQGPFAEATVVDCDARGMLDLRALAALPDDAWDAALVTNVFGALEDPSPYARLCRERGKVLVLDSALGLDAGYRTGAEQADEIVSFHHTKPWGMGEGGCVIVDRDDADVVRSVFNFGTYRGHATGSASFNGKISDFASAFILQRLRDFDVLSPRYHMQHARIATVARRLGYEVLGGIDRRRQATPSNVPLLAPHPIKDEHLENRAIVMRKYYRPLEDGHAVADDLFARIVNVPCHPELEGLPEEALRSCLAEVLAASRPRRSPPNASPAAS